MLRPAEPRSRATLIALRACHTAHRVVNEILHKPTAPLEQAKLPTEIPFARRADAPASWLPKVWRRSFFGCPSPWEWIAVGVVWALVAAFLWLALHQR